MVTAVEMRDPYTAGHQRRVAEIACRIASRLGVDDDSIDGIRMAGMIHDVGKIAVPAEILAKPGKITDIERSLINMHPEIGYQILTAVEFPWPISEIILQHHERYDGAGYPHKLSGSSILHEARILKVADSLEAIASHRPYRPGYGLDRALSEISAGRRSEYDAEVVDACLSYFSSGAVSLDVLAASW